MAAAAGLLSLNDTVDKTNDQIKNLSSRSEERKIFLDQMVDRLQDLNLSKRDRTLIKQSTYCKMRVPNAKS